jgi:tetratricopeptide (TPR) repeat protein
MAALAERWAGRSSTNTAWSGLKMFRESQLPPDDPGRQSVCAHFEKNLEAIVRSGIRAGAPVVLSTMAVNLKDCGPFASLPTSRLGNDARTNFTHWLQLGQRNEAAGDWTAARDAYTQAAAIDPRFAELQFRLGECLVRLDRPSEARAALERACASDALPFRADAALNAAILRVAARHTSERVISVDSAQQLAATAPTRIPGRESFFEHVHPNFEGNYRLARILAEAVVPSLPEPAKRDAAADWADSDRCDRRLGLTDWNRHAVIETVLKRIADAPYTNQLTSLEDRRFFAGQLAELRARMTPDHFTNAYALYREALSRRTNDFRLHENFAEYLEAVGYGPGAVAEWQAVRALIPHHFAAYANLGRVLGRQSKWEDARRNLEIAVRLEPRSPEAHLELAQVFAQQEEWPAAVNEYLHVLRLQPGNARVHVQLADTLAKQGKRAEAVEVLRQATRLDPGFWEARYLFGVELAMSGNFPGAQAEFEAVLERKPDHILARLNLGVALIRQGKAGPARRQFEEILRLDPANEKARHYLDTLDLMLQGAAPSPAPTTPKNRESETPVEP